MIGRIFDSMCIHYGSLLNCDMQLVLKTAAKADICIVFVWLWLVLST